MKNKTINYKCFNCLEERNKADLSRKYAHELKNIFITISTVVNSEIEFPTLTVAQNNNQNTNNNQNNNNNQLVDAGDVSPFIFKNRAKRRSKTNQNNNNYNPDSPLNFLKSLCDYGKTLIKEINELGKDYSDIEKDIKPFNISKAIDFCVDMFNTKTKYDKSKKNLEIYSDINFSYDKVIKSISETGFKIVLINLLTNSYKFTVKGSIVVRAVSIPKEKKIRILIKDSGKGFNPNEFIRNGCFYVYEKNKELNAEGSGLGLIIVNEIFSKFNIKLDCISNNEKGGSLFYFDLDDTYPYYDEINPQNLMTDSLSKIIKDINSGQKDNEFNSDEALFDLKENIIKIKKNKNKNIEKNKNENEIDSNSKRKISKKDLNIITNDNNLINIKNDEKKRFSFMNEDDLSPRFCNKVSDKNISLKHINNNIENNTKNLNVNIYNLNNATLFSFDKGSNKNEKNGKRNILMKKISNQNIMTPNKNSINKIFSSKKRKSAVTSHRKIEKANILKKIIDGSKKFNKLKSYNYSNNKRKSNQSIQIKNYNQKNDENKNNVENDINKTNSYLIKKLNDNKNNKKDYKKLLDKNINKTKFYLFELRQLFLKNEIYTHLQENKKRECITEPSSKQNSSKKLKKKKSFVNNNKIYIIICDDEEFVARSARELIINYYIKKGKDPHVYYTPNGIECLYLMYKLTFIQNRKIEYILMDLEMPYLNGITTCNIIKNIHETNVRVYILSGDEPDNCEADGCCNKPLNEIDIINKLDKEIENI